MSIYDEDWGKVDTPRRVSLEEQRAMLPSSHKSTYVPAMAASTTPVRAYPMDAGQDNTILDLSAALQAQDLNEHTTPLNRSLAFSVRMLLLVFLLSALAFGLCLVLLFRDSLGWPILIMAALAIGGYYWLNRLDYAHSPAGVEKDKIQAIRDVALDKQRGERALRREIMRAYLSSITGEADNA
jgi:hypothetical protein